ncbi:MAG TPA: DUF2892 domain-containing protein [Chitinophagales bacterium]|nr:DUF2892 domain-containing protein [Chitinophagales bacterium]
MKKNMGFADRAIRLSAAVVFTILYLAGIVSGTVGIILLVFAAIFALTSFIGFCPLYVPFNFSTKKGLFKKLKT